MKNHELVITLWTKANGTYEIPTYEELKKYTNVH